MTREAFRERLAQGALVADGALGTMLALRGVPQPYELANLTHAEVVREHLLRESHSVAEPA
jgi:methionine synthase I (cobalamin-dependent)